jgi:hypothetical protein
MRNGVCLAAQKMKKKPSRPSSHLSHGSQVGRPDATMGAKYRPIACAASEYLDICAYPVFPKMVVIGTEIKWLASNWRNKAILRGNRCPSGWHAPLTKRVAVYPQA